MVHGGGVMASATVTCRKCGEVLDVTPQLNSDLALICDDLAAENKRMREALEEIIDWACDSHEALIAKRVLKTLRK